MCNGSISWSWMNEYEQLNYTEEDYLKLFSIFSECDKEYVIHKNGEWSQIMLQIL